MTGRTAVFFAAENGHDAAAHILVAYGADPNQQDVVNFVTTEGWVGVTSAIE